MSPYVSPKTVKTDAGSELRIAANAEAVELTVSRKYTVDCTLTLPLTMLAISTSRVPTPAESASWEEKELLKEVRNESSLNAEISNPGKDVAAATESTKTDGLGEQGGEVRKRDKEEAMNGRRWWWQRGWWEGKREVWMALGEKEGKESAAPVTGCGGEGGGGEGGGGAGVSSWRQAVAEEEGEMKCAEAGEGGEGEVEGGEGDRAVEGEGEITCGGEAEEASFDGVIHAWLPGERQHLVRYNDGDEADAAPVSVPDTVGPVVAAKRAVPLVGVSPSPLFKSAPLDGLQSPPVPEGLAELLCTPGVVTRSGVDAGAEAHGDEQAQQWSSAPSTEYLISLQHDLYFMHVEQLLRSQ
ncbi:hypothetical protein CYMTET_24931 [Cymbomonas tetramitiformis]|uniref:Uncharacterized protein n=1 Tax=Cymbomonas tetramitiformis TaxID=36881 RepID=A0AAE0FUT4_9CHLO|nr:hypothetical protein CYMTET_24931 [Cymbomonas tetramitiformis]